jgi:hypothetical protein
MGGLGDRLRPLGPIMDPQFRLNDRDLVSDRPGWLFAHATLNGRRRGAKVIGTHVRRQPLGSLQG